MYEKHTWTSGEVITAEKLNHMEDGIASGSSGEKLIIAHITPTSMTEGECDMTISQIKTHINNGDTVVFELLGWLSGLAYDIDEVDRAVVGGKGFGLDLSNAPSIWEIEYGEAAGTRVPYLSITLTPIVQ